VVQEVNGGITVTLDAWTHRAAGAEIRVALGAASQTLTVNNHEPALYTAILSTAGGLHDLRIEATAGGCVIDNVCLADATPIATLTPGPSPTPGGGYCPAPQSVNYTLPLTPLVTFALTATHAITTLRAQVVTMTAGLTWALPVSAGQLALPFQYARAAGTEFALLSAIVTFLLLILAARLLVLIVAFIRANATWLLNVVRSIKQLIPFIG